MHSVEIGGRNYAVDLWWQVREGGIAPRKVMLALARSLARNDAEPFDCVVLRRHQFGLGSGLDMVSQPSLAASLRPAALSFLGLFCLQVDSDDIPGLWWVCAIRQGTIAGDGDKVFTSFKAARRHYLHLLDLLGKCDMELTCETPDKSMEAMASMLQPEARVEALNPPPKSKKGLLLVCGLVLAMCSLWAVNQFMEQKRMRQEQAALAELNARRRADREKLQAHPEQYFPRPVKSPLLAACVSELVGLPLVVQGWLLTESTCAQDSLILTYRHELGASYQFLPDKAVLTDTMTAKAVVPRHPSPPSPIPSFLTKEEATRLLYQITQDAGLALRLNWQPRPTKEIDGATLQAPWTPGQLELVLPENLLEPQLAQLLENIPGLNITAVTAAEKWTIKGAIHVR